MITKTKDKHLIRQALFYQIENVLISISDPMSGHPERLRELDIIDIEIYLEKIVGLHRNR